MKLYQAVKKRVEAKNNRVENVVYKLLKQKVEKLKNGENPPVVLSVCKVIWE